METFFLCIFKIKYIIEWKYWVDKNHYEKPIEWNMISPENIFVLKPRERVTLLFKFLSFRCVDSN